MVQSPAGQVSGGPTLKPLFERIAADELTLKAKSGDQLRARLWLAIGYKRAGLTVEAGRFARQARESLPEGWEREMSWIESVQLQSVRAAFEREFPPPK